MWLFPPDTKWIPSEFEPRIPVPGLGTTRTLSKVVFRHTWHWIAVAAEPWIVTLTRFTPFADQMSIGGPPPRAVTTIVSPTCNVASVDACVHGVLS